MTWSGYVDSLMAPEGVGDVAILGKDGSIWASYPEGNFRNVKADQIRPLLSNRSSLLTTGLTLGNKKYTLVQDQMDEESQGWVCLKSKSSTPDEPKCSAVVFQTKQTLILVEAKTPAVTGGNLMTQVQSTIDFLKQSGY